MPTYIRYKGSPDVFEQETGRYISYEEAKSIPNFFSQVQEIDQPRPDVKTAADFAKVAGTNLPYYQESGGANITPGNLPLIPNFQNIQNQIFNQAGIPQLEEKLTGIQSQIEQSIQNLPDRASLLQKELQARGIPGLETQLSTLEKSILEQNKTLGGLAPDIAQFEFPEALESLKDIGVTQAQLNMIAAQKRAPIARALRDLITSRSLVLQEYNRKRQEAIQMAQMRYQDALAKIRGFQSLASLMRQKITMAERRVNPLIRMIESQFKEGIRLSAAQKAKWVQSNREAAVVGLLSQGIRDPAQLFDYLNFDEKGNRIGDFTMDEITDVVDAVTKTEANPQKYELRGGPQAGLYQLELNPDGSVANVQQILAPRRAAGRTTGGTTQETSEFKITNAQKQELINAGLQYADEETKLFFLKAMSPSERRAYVQYQQETGVSVPPQEYIQIVKQQEEEDLFY